MAKKFIVEIAAFCRHDEIVDYRGFGSRANKIAGFVRKNSSWIAKS
jgi:hypothetical protein